MPACCTSIRTNNKEAPRAPEMCRYSEEQRQDSVHQRGHFRCHQEEEQEEERKRRTARRFREEEAGEARKHEVKEGERKWREWEEEGRAMGRRGVREEKWEGR